MLGCCGNRCSTCIAFLATQADDDAQRADVAAKWSVQYKTTFLPEDIHCDGCTADGRHISFCEHVCTIRTCCMGKGNDTCAACEDSPCEELETFFQSVPQARENLASLRK
jgi:hypothetical protein